MRSVAIILAAGNSTRAGTAKPFVRMGKETLLEKCARTFAAHRAVSHVVVVCRVQDMARVTRMFASLRLRKPHVVVRGGTTRQASVWSGIVAAQSLGSAMSTPLLIHNSANPFVEARDITHILRALKKCDAAAVGQRITDTIKVISRTRTVIRTLDRATLWRTQTPQCMSLRTALAAHERARKDRYTGTDDIELVERMGKRVQLVPCSDRNFKITTPADIRSIQQL